MSDGMKLEFFDVVFHNYDLFVDLIIMFLKVHELSVCMTAEMKFSVLR